MDDLFTVVERGKKEWESVVDSISEGVALFDRPTLIIRRVNWPLARWLDSTPQQMVGADLLAALADCQAEGFHLNDLLSLTSAGIQEVQRVSTGQTWLLSVFPIIFPSQPAVNSVLVVRDITQEKLLQQGIIDAEKRGAMVRTVAGIAQQIIPSVSYIQQHLSSINTHIQEMRSAFVDYRIALRSNESQPAASAVPITWETIEARHRVEFMLTDVEQAIRQSMQDLMRIYRSIDDMGDLQGSASKMQYDDVNLILENTLSLIWPELGRKVSIERRYQKDLPLVRCNQIRLQTALMALIGSFAQTANGAGRITLTTAQSGDAGVQIVVQVASAAHLPADATDLWAVEPGLNIDPKAGLVLNILKEHSGHLVMAAESDGSLTATVTLPVDGLE